MTTIYFNASTFKGLFPAFKDVPDASLQITWNAATTFITDQTSRCYAGRFAPARQEYAIQLLTAHLSYLNANIASGNGGGLMQSATIDKVTVTLTPPPVPNEFRYWLNQSPYGQQLLALLETAAVGGFFAGGGAVRGSTR